MILQNRMIMGQNFLTQIAEGANVILQISATDLKEVVKAFYHEEKERTEEAISRHREQPTLSRKEAAEKLGVTLTTLWHWQKSGYLKPVKIGTKVMYRPCDIENLLNSKFD